MSLTFTARIEESGLAALDFKLKGLSQRKIMQEIAIVTREHQQGILKAVQTYPAPPPNSTYIRTGDLHAGQNASPVEISGSRVTAEVFSAGPQYDKFVLDEAAQAAIHRGRWKTYQAIAGERIPAYINAVQALIGRLLGR